MLFSPKFPKKVSLSTNFLNNPSSPPSFIQNSSNMHIRAQSQQFIISPRKRFTTEFETGPTLERGLKTSQSYKAFPEMHSTLPKTIDNGLSINADNERRLLQSCIRQISTQLHQVRYHRFSDVQLQEKAVSEVCKNLNLKLAAKNTLIQRIYFIVNQLEKNNNIPKQNVQKIKQIGNLIRNNQRNILIKERTFEDPNISKQKIVIIYREQGGQDWRQWKNNFSKIQEQCLKLVKEIEKQKQTIYELRMSKNSQKSQKTAKMQMVLQSNNIEVENLRKIVRQSQQKKNNLINIQNQLIHIKKNYENCQRQLQKEKIINSTQKIKYKEIIKRLQEKLLYNAIQLQTIEMLKEKLIKYQIIFEKSQEEIKFLNHQLKTTSNICSIIQTQTQDSHHKHNLQSQIIDDSIHEINLETKNQFFKNINPQTDSRNFSKNSKNIQFSKDNTYEQLLNKINKLQLALEKAEQYIFGIQKQKIQQQSTNKKLKEQKTQSIKDTEYKNEIEEYFRYKTDPRYQDVKKKLIELKKTYNSQTSLTRQFMTNYQKQQLLVEQQVASTIRQAVEAIKKLDETIIIKKSGLKKFKRSKLQELRENIVKMKEDYNEMRRYVKKEIEENVKIIEGKII